MKSARWTKTRSIVTIAGVLAVAALLTATVASGATTRSDTSTEVMIERGSDATDSLSTQVRDGLSDQGLVFEKLVKLGVDQGDTFWIGNASGSRTCLVIHHSGAGVDWVSAASCLPPELFSEMALPLSVWTQTTETRVALLSDSTSAEALGASSALKNARVVFGNLVIPADSTWTSDISASIELADGTSTKVELLAGPSDSERGN